MPDHPEPPPEHHPLSIAVFPAESGIKLLSFLEKRLDGSVPAGQLHRWVRTGQVRVNKKRAKPFMRLQEGDSVRVPPFARVQEVASTPGPDLASAGEGHILWRSASGGALRVVGHADGVLALHKPAGLAVQPGSGLNESVSQILAVLYAGCPFTPAPAHRLDRHTSGVLLAGLTHAAQARLCAWFSQSGVLAKEYLAWVEGVWPSCGASDGEVELYDHIRKEMGPDGKERMVVVPNVASDVTPDTPASTIFAQCRVRSLRHAPMPGNGTATLLLVRLLTGRTHQIRVQLASRGFPIIGDRRYKGPACTQLLLHACRITLPDGTHFETMPDWPKPFAVEEPLTSLYLCSGKQE